MAAAVSGNKLIESRRKLDNARRDMEASAAQDRKVMLIACFENSTTQKIEKRNKDQLYQSRRKEYDDNLLFRRRNLADLYNREMEEWRLEVLSKVETQDDRKARIMQKAYALRDAREKARQELVEKKYTQQWRDSCDDARTLDSKAAVRYMNDERLRQIREKQERKQNLTSQENAFLVEWNRQLEALERKDNDKKEFRRRAEHDTAEALRNQIDTNTKAKKDFYQTLKRTDEEELNRLRADIDADEALQQKRKDDAYQRGKEIMRFNADNLRIKEEETYIQQEHDTILLDYALRKEAEAIAEEEAKKNANRQASLQFRKYLEEQMVKEAEDTAFVDEIRRQEEEKVWKARDEALQAREDARNQLMAMVDSGRQEQIRHKHEFLTKEKQEDFKFVKKFMDDAQDAVQKERDASDRRRKVNVENNVELIKQIDQKKHTEEIMRQEVYLADKEMKYRERMHQQRLAEQAGSVRMAFPLQKNNWYS